MFRRQICCFAYVAGNCQTHDLDHLTLPTWRISRNPPRVLGEMFGSCQVSTPVRVPGVAGEGGREIGVRVHISTVHGRAVHALTNRLP